jgi:hypothetical protein
MKHLVDNLRDSLRMKYRLWVRRSNKQKRNIYYKQRERVTHKKKWKDEDYVIVLNI